MFRRGPNKDYYAVLQVDPRAEPEVIEAAYRRLSRKYHPDLHEGRDAGRRMREINEAYEVLGDPARRAAYDRHRAFAFGPEPADRPAHPPDLLRLVAPYLAVAILALVAIRLLPFLLRPPILIFVAIAVFVFLFYRRMTRR